jgi:DNA-binding NarL/FixJ family response regulator
VVIANDDPIYRAGLTHLLQLAGVEVVASANNATDLVRKARAHQPDVVVVDIDMAPTLTEDERIETARVIRSIDPRMSILILSQSPDERYALAALDDQPAGFGYLVKERIRDAEDFTSSLFRVARGGTAIDPLVVSRLAGRKSTEDPVDKLSDRERQVLALMAEGRSNRFVAGDLVVTIAAVERHITSIFAKLRLGSNGSDHRRVLAVLQYLNR